MISNEAVGTLLGVSHAAVSRYKSGHRFPEIHTMAQIAVLFDWSMDDQYKAHQEGRYSDEFTRRMDAYDPVGAVVKKTTGDQ